jgi:hypothetical protein
MNANASSVRHSVRHSSSQTLSQIASFFMNLCFHILILLTFLVMFFFKYVSGLTSSEIDENLKIMIQNQTSQCLNVLSTGELGPYIKWDVVETVADTLIDESKKGNQTIIDNNTDLYNNSLCTIFMIVLAIVVFIGYFTFRKIDINLKFILMENLIIFSFVGMIEIYFFLNIASKYVPVLPDNAMTTIFARLKFLLSS